MPPCHGGDRRFESGRARQTEFLILILDIRAGFLALFEIIYI